MTELRQRVDQALDYLGRAEPTVRTAVRKALRELLDKQHARLWHHARHQYAIPHETLVTDIEPMISAMILRVMGEECAALAANPGEDEPEEPEP